jgi:hypothetical protein
VPKWVKVSVLVLLAAAALLLPGLLDWVVNGRADLAIVGAAGLLAVIGAIAQRYGRERTRS